MTSPRQIKKFLYNIIIEVFTISGIKVPSWKFNYSTRLLNFGPASIDLVRLVNVIEKRFNVFYEEGEMRSKNFRSINAITRYLTKKIMMRDATIPDAPNFHFSEGL